MVDEASKKILSELGFTFIDNLVVSLDGKATKKELDIIWKQMEALVRNLKNYNNRS